MGSVINNIVDSCNGDVKRVFSLLSSLGRNHDIIDAFGKKLIENPDLNWEEYISQFYSYSSEDILITYLENIHHITLYDSDFGIEEWKDVDKLIQELMSKRARKIEKAISLSKDPENEQERQYNLRSNEAKQLELIYQLRSEGNRNYWFVTFDQFIYDTCVSVYKASKNESKYFPCFMKPNKWLEILKVSQKESIDGTIFNDILMSSAMHHAVNSVEATVITEILRRNIDTKISDKKVLSNMFSEAVNKAVITDIKNEINTGKNNSGSIANIDDVIKSVLYDRMSKYDEIFKKQNIEIEKTKKEKDKEHRRSNYYKAQLSRLLKEKRGRKNKPNNRFNRTRLCHDSCSRYARQESRHYASPVKRMFDGRCARRIKRKDIL
ncbi:MAG: hypothetical protein HC831_28285 [Chloroflexia bacterium]|nr:hypothetical protein [Chloroflexia bacterium]